MAEGTFENLSDSSEKKSSIGNGKKGPSDFFFYVTELSGQKMSP